MKRDKNISASLPVKNTKSVQPPDKHVLPSAHLAHKVFVKGSPSPMERNAPARTTQTEMAGGPPQLAGGSPQLQTCDGSPQRKRRSGGEEAPRKQPRSSKDLSPVSMGAETLTLDFWEDRRHRGGRGHPAISLRIHRSTMSLHTQTGCCPSCLKRMARASANG